MTTQVSSYISLKLCTTKYKQVRKGTVSLQYGSTDN